MALYKEVQEYYEDGLQVPDDVTLLFADDNFGNVRRHPTAKERARRGGIGVRTFASPDTHMFPFCCLLKQVRLTKKYSCIITSSTLGLPEATNG